MMTTIYSKNTAMKCKATLQFPDCEFPMKSNDQINTFIADRLSSRKSTSLIRLGDGEGAILARPTSENTTLWSTVLSHFGPHVTSDFINSLADELTSAIDNADVIGIRDDLLKVHFPDSNYSLGKVEFTEQFKALFNLRPAEKNINYAGALRLALTHRFFSTHIFRNGVVFGSAWMHFGLSQSGGLARMISTEKHIGLISSRPALAEELESRLNVIVNYYEIPDIYCELRKIRNENLANQLPEQLKQTMEALTVKFQGQLFLVGAGIFGKVYCNKIKKLGGVAIDIGAVCDAWIGIPSRPLVIKTLYDNSVIQVPEGLLLKHQIKNL
jgi:hypothetical protein